MACLLIANMIPFVNISNFYKVKIYLRYGIQSSTLVYGRRQSCILVCKGKIFWSLPMASVMQLHFSIQEEEYILEHSNDKCQLCNIGNHLITLLNIFMPKYQYAHLNATCHETTLLVKLLIINVTQYTIQNRVSDTEI